MPPSVIGKIPEDQKLPSSSNNDVRLVRNTLARASTLASSITTRAKASSRFAKAGLERIERLSQPLVSTVVALGDPLVEKVDNGIDRARKIVRREEPLPGEEPLRARVHQLGTLVVESSWFNRVDNIIGFQAFFVAAQEQYAQLMNRGKEFSKEEFLAGLKNRLAGIWDERLRPVAEAFYTKAVDTFSSSKVETEEKDGKKSKKRRDTSEQWATLQAQFRNVWEQRVVSAWEQKVVSPATALYSTALNFYISAKENTKSAKAFIEGMKNRLGSSWNDNLEQPLKEFYTGAKRAAQEDLIDLQNKLQKYVPTSIQHAAHNAAAVAQNLTIGNVVSTGKSITSKIYSGVTGVVTGTWSLMMDVTQTTMDIVIPPDEVPEPKKLEEEEGEQKGVEVKVKPRPTLKSIRKEATKRIGRRLSRRYQQVRKFSSERLQSIIHIDLIAYAEEIFGKSRCAAKAAYQSVAQKLGLTINKVSSSIDDVKNDVSSTGRKISGSIPQRLGAVVARSREVTSHCTNYFLTREIRKLPSDAVHFTVQVPSMIRSVVKGTTSKQSSEYDELIQKLRNFNTALRDVFIWNGSIDSQRKDKARQEPEKRDSSSNNQEEEEDELHSDKQGS